MFTNLKQNGGNQHAYHFMQVSALHYFPSISHFQAEDKDSESYCKYIFFKKLQNYPNSSGNLMARKRYPNTLMLEKSIRKLLTSQSSAAHTVNQIFYVQHKWKETSGAALQGQID